MRLKPMIVAWLFLSGLTACGRSDRDRFEYPSVPAGGDTTIQSRSGEAFTLPAANLNDLDLERHISGDGLFEATFVSSGPLHAGLGPVFNNNACAACHIENGRGVPTLGRSGSLNSPMLVRISIDPVHAASFPGVDANPRAGGPIEVPGLGQQLQDQAVYGATPELVISLNWEFLTDSYADGTEYTLRYPVLSYSGSEQNMLLINNAAILRSLRQTPPIHGLGLLEAISDETLLAMEDPDDRNHDGIRGHANRVWDPFLQKEALGRFGWKGGAPSLLVQAAAAFAEDMGVHNFLFPGTEGEEVTREQVELTAFYTQTLGVPDRDRTFADTREGEKLFHETGCASCHRPVLTTGNDHPIEALREQTIAPYTDLLLHDMGSGLADQRPDYAATGSEWRTPPLWGLGLTLTVLPNAAFLHDGRARTVEEAILWHGGEAQGALEKFKALSSGSRRELLKFLKSL